MPSKKRKLNFNLDDIEEQTENLLELHKTMEECSILEAADFLDVEKIVGFSVIKFGLRFVESLLSVLSVVPEESGPWRAEIIKSQLSLLIGATRLTAEQECMVKIISESSTYKRGFPGQEGYYSQVFSQVLANQCDGADQSSSGFFAGCIAPPTRVCFSCNNELQKNNKPTYVTYYLASGPLPFLKVELRCRSCKINYGIVKYGNVTDGCQYYGSLRMVEASDVVYIDRLVMETFTSLR